MVNIPLAYIARNLTARKLTTLLTAGGMALVVYVFATVLMLAAGLEQTLVATGQPALALPGRRHRVQGRAARQRVGPDLGADAGAPQHVRQIAQQAIDLIEVDYEQLPVVNDLEQALAVALEQADPRARRP